MSIPFKINDQNQLAQSLKESQITIAGSYLQELQRRFAAATILIPFLGSIPAVVTVFELGIGKVEVGLLISAHTLTMIGITILGSTLTHGPTIQWFSIYRRHHKYSDRLEDPHSPHYYTHKKCAWIWSLWHRQVVWMLNSGLTNTMLFSKDLLKDPVIAKVNRFYLTLVILCLTTPAVVGKILTSSCIGIRQGFLWGGFVRIFLIIHVFWTINSLMRGLSVLSSDRLRWRVGSSGLSKKWSWLGISDPPFQTG